MQVAQERPIFVVGMPRSGTSMVQHALSRHPDLAVAPETHYVSEWAPRAARLDLTDPRDFDRFWEAFTHHTYFRRLEVDADAVRATIVAAGQPTHRTIFAATLGAYAQRLGKPRWGEKTPYHLRHLDTIFDWYPDAHVIFLLRDPRAVARSWRTFDEAWARQSVPEIACRWRSCARIALRWKDHPQVNVVRYADLVTLPTRHFRDLAEGIGLTWVPEMIQRPDGTGERDFRSGTLDPRQAVSGSGVERWREDLEPVAARVIERIAHQEMSTFGFDPSEPVGSLGQLRGLGRVAARRLRHTAAGQLQRAGRRTSDHEASFTPPPEPRARRVGDVWAPA